MSQWVTSVEVANATDVTHQAIQKRLGQWETRTVPGCGQGGISVEIAIDSLPADIRAKLALYRIDRPKPADLEGLPQDQISAALAKARVVRLADLAVAKESRGNKTAAVERWLKKFNAGKVDTRLAEVVQGPISSRTLHNWRKALNTKGLAGLVDHRGRPRGRGSSVTPEIQAWVLACLKQNMTQRAANIYRLMPAQFPGKKLPSQKTVRTLVSRLKQERREELLALHQPSLHKRLYQVSRGRADSDLTGPNQRWEADSTRGDIMLRPNKKVIEIAAKDGRRYTLIALIDVYSRRPVILLEEKGGGYHINLALMKAVRRLGLPLEIIMDQGKDYQSVATQAFCAALGIEVPEIPGYTPEAKPHVERLFDTLQSQLFATLPGYTANKLSNRREEITVKLSREQLQVEIDRWVEAHERRVHSSTGQTPLERGNPEGWARQTAPESQLRLLLNPPVERSIRQGRIRNNNGYYYHPDLDYLDGSAKVMVREDPEDAGILYVYAPDGQFICIAEDLQRLDMSQAEIQAANKAWRDVRKARKAEARAEIKALDLTDLNRRALNMEIAAAEPVKLAPVMEVDIPGAAEAAQAAARRKAPEMHTPETTHHDDTPPLFVEPRERYEWLIGRLADGHKPTDADMDFIAWFEGQREWRLNGGQQYRDDLMSRAADQASALAVAG